MMPGPTAMRSSSISYECQSSASMYTSRLTGTIFKSKRVDLSHYFPKGLSKHLKLETTGQSRDIQPKVGTWLGFNA